MDIAANTSILSPQASSSSSHKSTSDGEYDWSGLMKSFGGMISFELKNNSVEAATKLLSSTKIFALAESLGGVESLINHPASMTHASIPREERIKNGLSDSLIRLSVGIEDVEDLIEDLKQAIG
jgi:cystathionine beta-lyase